jgi:hypothetical protein
MREGFARRCEALGVVDLCSFSASYEFVSGKIELSVCLCVCCVLASVFDMSWSMVCIKSLKTRESST